MNNTSNYSLDKVKAGVPEWLARPFRLVSLLDMITFNLKLFYLATVINAKHGVFLALTPPTSDVEGHKKPESIIKTLRLVLRLCNELGLEFTAGYVEEKIEDLERRFSEEGALTVLRELDRHIEREISMHLFMQVPRDMADYYDKPALFGQLVADNFADATYDISEAGSCLATDRYTACVMHLMRSLEVALDAVGLGVGVPNAVVEAKNSWETLLRKISDQIKINDNAGDPLWPPKRQFFVDTHAHLFSVKNAWRNPSMHLEKKYDDKEALRIYNAVKDFMEHLATHLDASGQFTP